MIEKHPYGNFVPKNSKYLFLGSFTGKPEPEYDWFFTTKRNQFWSILEAAYGIELRTKIEKQRLFSKLKLAITDIILSCERSKNNNSDNNLINIVYNTDAIAKILRRNNIRTIFFSSRFAEHLFKRHLKLIAEKYTKIELITLPSPSPRYAAISKTVKISRYKELLPKL